MKTFVLLFALICGTTSEPVKFYVVRHWKYINYTWPDEDSLKTATATGTYNPENIIVSGVKYFEDYFYVTSPRMKSGVPATLSRIKAGKSGVSPNLEPFPSWEMNSEENCNNLQNVQNIEIDPKGQMWIIDSGRVQTLSEPIGKCNPKLVIYDLKEKRVSTVYQFPEDVAGKNGTYLYDLVVDNTDGGYAYITDNSASDPGIIVYSAKENRSWKVRDSKTMRADPSATHLTINNFTINAPINIAGIALGPKIHSNEKVVINEDREVFYCPLSSLHLYSINSSILKNENFSKTNIGDSIKDIGMKESQTVGMVMDNEGVLYYNLLGLSAVGKWDSHTPLQSGQKLIARDKTYLEWPNSFAFDRNGNLTILMNRLNKFVSGKIDLNQYNFRLISAFVGGNSYLYDEHFKYDSRSAAEPKPEPSDENSVTTVTHSEHNHNHTDSGVIITKGTGSGSRFVVSVLTVSLGILLTLA